MGRTTFSGPVRGGYACFLVTMDDLANNEDETFTFRVPFSCRVVETSACLDDVTSDPQYRIYNGGSANPPVGTTDIVALRNFAAADTTEVITPTSSPALAARDLAKGDALRVQIVADAGDAADAIAVLITVAVTGHVVADSAND